MVSEKRQVATFCLVPEMSDTEIVCKQLSSKDAVTLLGRLQGFQENGEWSSMGTFSLVEDEADRCLGSIDHKRQLGIGAWEGQRRRLGKTGVQSFKGSQLIARHLYWALMSASQRDEGRCDFRTVRDETAVEVDHAKESPELAFGSRVWEIGYCCDFSLVGPYTLVI